MKNKLYLFPKKYLYFWWVILIFIWLLLTIKSSFFWYSNGVIFLYPKLENVQFAWEKVPFDSEHFFIKERFDKEFIINSNTLYQFYLYIKRYPLYISYIEKVLKKYQVPSDFKYLAIAESALRNDVISDAWAVWIWQFIPDTAKRYWLRVDDEVDERYNFEKSTDAAARFFSDTQKIFQNRTLVAAAYNRWENGLQRDLKEQKVSSYYDLYLNDETSRYIFRILAIKYMIESYLNQKWVLDFVVWGTYEVPITKEIHVSWKIEDLIEWSKNNGINYNTVKILNPWILKHSLPEWDWSIKVLTE